MQDAGQSEEVKVKVIEIGDWNMDSTASKTITTGIPLDNIRAVHAIIRGDSGTLLIKDITEGGAIKLEEDGFENVRVKLERTDAGVFDNSNFDATTYNRGWVTCLFKSYS